MTPLVVDDSQKTPLAQGLQKLGAAKAQDAITALGKSLPCTVASVDGPGIVTVNFAVANTPAPLPKVQMPVSKFSYINFPIKTGDIGVALAADLRTGGLTGLGSGTPNLQDTVGNLSALTFFPLGTNSQQFIDAAALELFGNILCTPSTLSFFAAARKSKQTVTGAVSAIRDPAAQAVIRSLVAALAAYGLITNGTT